MEPTRFHRRLIVELLGLEGGDAARRLAPALSEARVDLNPHQVEAAVFALESLPRGGCLLADEVGLGKTIEAGMVLAQLHAEGKHRQLVLAPATLRAQWQAELADKFGLSACIVDGRTPRGELAELLAGRGPFICSHPFAANRADTLAQVPWDVVVIDEAHRLRNAWRPGNKVARALRTALRDRPKLLLTATPLQNDLLELFGLLSLLDASILGPEHAFRAQFVDVPTAVEALKARLEPVVRRTLRRQVREYVRFTHRRSLVEDFAPSADEESLYARVSDYLRRSQALALDPGRKTLLTLVYRKLLASSTFAIAPTLRKLAESIRERLLARGAGTMSGADDAADPFVEEAEAWEEAAEVAPVPSRATLERELKEVEQYAAEAESIRVNAKGDALLRALERTFSVAREHGWPQKAVVFTESRRTQAYLASLLEGAGYGGRISLLSGDASTPEARNALVAEFRDRTQVLLSTEAGAEGLNLQFCNLVVNYDLPWNPQRIEQRIGRCHRYGQARDVLVLNFLNRRNAADARLLELLEEKLHLFDGVFGASDEVLGALESGLDFERRVLDIYQSCRTPEEIHRAFDALRAELDTRIDAKMEATRSLLIERFDGDVHRRLRVAGQTMQAALETHRSRVRQLAGLGTALAPAERPLDPEPLAFLELDGASLPPRLAPLHGKEGWWFAYRFRIRGLHTEERLVHSILLRDGDGFRSVDAADAERLLEVPAREAKDRAPPARSIGDAQAEAVDRAREAVRADVERATRAELDLLLEKADRYAEDCLLEERQAAEKARLNWEAERKRLVEAQDPPERDALRARVEKLEREHRRRLAALRAAEDERYAGKDRERAALLDRARVVDERRLVASAYFWIQ